MIMEQKLGRPKPIPRVRSELQTWQTRENGGGILFYNKDLVKDNRRDPGTHPASWQQH